MSRNGAPTIDNFDTSLLSLMDRARLSALAEIDGDPGVRSLVMGVLGKAPPARTGRKARELPPQWSQIHVLDRLEEAYETLARLPMMTRPKQYGNAMPSVVRDRIPLLIQAEMAASGDLERQDDSDDVRLSVTAAQISRMDQAFGWPVDFLLEYPEMAKAVCLKAIWGVAKANISERCLGRGMNHKFFNRQWQHALTIIAVKLIQKKVPVT